MQEFVTLAHLPQTDNTPLSQVRQQFEQFQQVLAQAKVKITASYATLGRYDVIFILEGPDITAVQAALVGAASAWPIKTETLGATPVSTFISALDQLMAVPSGRTNR